MIYKRVWPRIFNNVLYISDMDIPSCKTQTDTKSWVLGVTVAMVTEAKDLKIAKLTDFKAILERYATQ